MKEKVSSPTPNMRDGAMTDNLRWILVLGLSVYAIYYLSK